MNEEAVVCDDGLPRCPWAVAPSEYRLYHDTEWGRPVCDDDIIFERLCLEGFQSGLSWLTILRKREAFRRAFASFDPAVVCGFGDEDIERLLADASIVRHRGKIEAAVGNARALVDLQRGGTTLASLFWAYEVPRGLSGNDGPVGTGAVPAATVQSKALSVQLRQRGFRFVGPTTVYAAMQAIGVVNDHLRGCHFRAAADGERWSFFPPRPAA
jgi:DNA-3-methyladenine glycosylase I